MVTIYVLCGGDGLPRYVGMTRRLKHRIGQYRSRGGGHTTHLRNWLKATPNFSLVPIDLVEEARADIAERAWIAHYKEIGADLMNYTAGGERGCQLSQAYREKLSTKARALMRRGLHNFQVPHLEAKRIEAVRKALRGRPRTPAQLAAASVTIRRVNARRKGDGRTTVSES